MCSLNEDELELNELGAEEAGPTANSHDAGVSSGACSDGGNGNCGNKACAGSWSGGAGAAQGSGSGGLPAPEGAPPKCSKCKMNDAEV